MSGIFRLWVVGEEYPFSRNEFKKICKGIKVENYSFFGDSLYSSFNFINPYKIFKKILKATDISCKIKKEKGTFLDSYMSYALVLYAKNKSQ